jgi:hypothetical protein
VSPRAAERRSRRGAESEEIVGQRLLSLDAEWYVINDVPLADTGDQIAHVAIGPGGVYVVSAEMHRGKKIWVAGETIMVNGFRAYHTRTSRAMALRTQQLLTDAVGFEVPVFGIVAVVGAVQFTVRDQPRDGKVYVTTSRGARRWLRQQPTRLNDQAVERIFAMARRSTTWQSSGLFHQISS